ncbi:3' exoribonuclease family protein [Aspergillus luchuensis]|uniref:3' exoribonuclease family protein n=1 Tax=Aspergillus kawachii TaxID=1069201 RepID=A0A146FG94_ASPKA|nr:3' exoribonuclease family protein [Aspergillus luchuensis]
MSPWRTAALKDVKLPKSWRIHGVELICWLHIHGVPAQGQFKVRGMETPKGPGLYSCKPEEMIWTNGSLRQIYESS